MRVRKKKPLAARRDSDGKVVSVVPEGVVFEIDIIARRVVNTCRVETGEYRPVHSNFYAAMDNEEAANLFDYLAAHFGYYAPTPSPPPDDEEGDT